MHHLIINRAMAPSATSKAQQLLQVRSPLFAIMEKILFHNIYYINTVNKSNSRQI